METETSPAPSAGAPEPPAWLATNKKGRTIVTWNEPGEWTHDPEKKLSFARFRLGVDDRGAATMMLVVKYEPGSYVEPHYHGADYCSIVVEGSIEVTRRNHEVGSMRFENAGTVYGPLVAGPEGCTVIDVFATGVADPSRTAMNWYVKPDSADGRNAS